MKSAAILGSTYPLKEMEKYYKPLLENENKKLDNVIFQIVWYEFMESRKDWVIKNSMIGELEMFCKDVEDYIQEKMANITAATRFKENSKVKND